MVKIKDNWEMPNTIPNKAEIPILNHRDDGENSGVKRNGETIKYFSFRTLYELMITHDFRDCDVAIAEDFFWTGMPFVSDGEVLLQDEDWDIMNSCVVASTWGTPCVVVGDKAWACYEELPADEFPGVYLNEWDPDFLNTELEKAGKFLQAKLIEKFSEEMS